MFTKWNEVESWIRDNRLDKWIFARNDRALKQESGGEPNDKIVDSDYYGDSLDSKLELTKRALENYNGRVYGYGWQGKKVTGGICCIVDLGQFGPQQAATVGGVSESDIQARIDAAVDKVRNQFERDQIERDRREIDEERKEFRQEKESAIGLIVGYLSPFIKSAAQKRVAGTPIDTKEDIEVSRIIPTDEHNEEEGVDVFTDEESEKLYALMERFKAVEPDYLQLIESVVEMAESRNPMYATAKGFLIKK